MFGSRNFMCCFIKNTHLLQQQFTQGANLKMSHLSLTGDTEESSNLYHLKHMALYQEIHFVRGVVFAAAAGRR
jgi:hypothetical protein